MEKNGNKCISFGKCYKKLWFIILGLIVTYLVIIIVMLSFDFHTMEKNINKKNTINFMSFLFFVNLCESFLIILYFILKKNIVSKKDDSSKKKEELNGMKLYIFNEISIKLSRNDKKYMIIFIVLKLGLDIMYISYFLFIDDNFYKTYIFCFTFKFELIFLFLLSKYLYNNQFYRHQYVSIILLTLISLGDIIFQYANVGIGKFFVILSYRIGYSFLKSVLIIYIKGLMDYKNISPYKVCFIFGIFNFIIVTIAYIIVSFIPCKLGTCFVEYNGDNYFGNILLIFSFSGLFMLFFSILRAVLTVLNYIIIQDFSVCHSFFVINLSEIREEIAFIKKYYENISYIIFNFVVVFLISFFLILVFLEIIELNICGLSYNTKRNIELRATSDSKYSIIDDINDDENSNLEDFEEIRSQEELNKMN